MSDYKQRLGLNAVNDGAASTNGFFATHGREVHSTDPTTGESLGSVKMASVED